MLNIALLYNSAFHLQIFKNNENMSMQTHKNAHNIIICHSQRVEVIQMPIKWWKTKQNMVYPYTRILFGNKKK